MLCASGNNQCWRVLAEIEIAASEVFNHLSQISDQVVQLGSDANCTVAEIGLLEVAENIDSVC